MRKVSGTGNSKVNAPKFVSLYCCRGEIKVKDPILLECSLLPKTTTSHPTSVGFPGARFQAHHMSFQYCLHSSQVPHTISSTATTYTGFSEPLISRPPKRARTISDTIDPYVDVLFNFINQAADPIQLLSDLNDRFKEKNTSNVDTLHQGTEDEADHISSDPGRVPKDQVFMLIALLTLVALSLETYNSPKFKLFFWRLLLQGLTTKEHLNKWLNIDSTCSLCHNL
ncbi:uncharacterized protein LOC122059010 [Macadamia integrifolia]|uniref:uncharacterized protein LOC122059010 n=1 Tax=Macadamia integrifolia TaxID=60698 RepID=UPI001C50051F|nr:uncharacterized protein LOC122059010 [Macadamia integrifolia]